MSELEVRLGDDVFFFFQAEDGIRDVAVTGVQTCALPIFHFVRPIRWRSTRLQIRKRGVELVEIVIERRSEERRVGKECRAGWVPDRERRKRGNEGDQRDEHDSSSVP